MMTARRLAVAGALGLLVTTACTHGTGEMTLEPGPRAAAVRTVDVSIVPRPSALAVRSGALELAQLSAIGVSNPADAELLRLAGYASELLRVSAGTAPPVRSDPMTVPAEGHVVLRITDGDGKSPEAYQLAVTPSSVTISAAGHAGLFYGLQTLRQLLPPTPATDGTGWAIPALHIEDAPRFGYRGMHLDVGRHLFPVAFVKRYLDLMARYKMNTFHWHLTEDQGWRIEITKYPRLTEVGSCRSETMVERNFDPYVGDGEPYCGFYTQDEVREIVAYAADRYITVIPEIEMPGHSVAALAAYPELACTEGPFEVATRWGVTEDIYCPKEETFAFLEDVLTEVMALFPSRYIHIGGDEAPKARWEQSEIAQEVIRREGLADEHELQSWFIRRIERFLLAHDRRLIGWDEILEGGLAPEATVMSWRGMDGGIEAARQGHDVIMTPTSHVYFDYYQGDPDAEPLAIGGYTPLEKVYGFEPVPAALRPDEAQHILGAQGNVWTEYIKTPEYVEYMVLPRMLALAEVVWTRKEQRDWEDFAARLPAQFGQLDASGTNYRVPHVRGLETDRITLDDTMTVALRALAGTEIHYTLDGSDPTSTSPTYRTTLRVPVDESGVTVTARAFLPGGRTSGPSSATLRRATPRAPAGVDPAMLAPGIRYLYFEADVRSVESLVGQAPVASGVAHAIAIPDSARAEHVGLVFTGYVRIDRTDVYRFALTSDDGGTLHIGGQPVVNNDGPHGPSTKRGMIALAPGYHPITVGYFQGGGGRALSLTIAASEADPAPVAERLFYER